MLLEPQRRHGVEQVIVIFEQLFEPAARKPGFGGKNRQCNFLAALPGQMRGHFGNTPPFGIPRVGGDGHDESSCRTSRDYLGNCVPDRSEEHTSELQSLMRISYAVFCLKKKTQINI